MPGNNAKRSLSVSNVETANESDMNKKKPERGIYQPPSGKYSTQKSQNNANNGNQQQQQQKRKIFSNGANRRSAGGRF